MTDLKKVRYEDNSSNIMGKHLPVKNLKRNGEMFKDSEILNEAMKVEVDDEKVRGRMLQDISQRNVLSWYLYVII